MTDSQITHIEQENAAESSNHTQMQAAQACQASFYLVSEAQLPLSCPMEGLPLWNAHPKVYLPIEKTGEERCPYCGTQYLLKNAHPTTVE